MIAVLQGRADDARRDFDEAMRLNQEVGDSWMVAISHHNLANAHRDLGDFEAARTHYRGAAQAFHRYDDQWALAFLFEDVASLAWSTGAPELACELLGAADRSRDEIGSPRAASLEAELATRSAATEIDDVASAGARARGRQQSTEFSVNIVLHFCVAVGPTLSEFSHTE
jgi:tetratricopeptide (TPR) repeat protein